MALDMKNSAWPLTLLLFAVGAMAYGGVTVTSGVLGSVILAAVWFLLVPVLMGSGVSRNAGTWFVRAGAFALGAAAVGASAGTFVDAGNWTSWLVQLAVVLSALMALIGSLVALAGSR